MTMNFKSYEKKIDSKYYEASWLNNGLFSFTEATEERPKNVKNFMDMFDWLYETIYMTVLPSEMKIILEKGEFEGPVRITPGLFPTEGQVKAWTVDDKFFIESYEMFQNKTISLPKEVWQEMYNACVKNRDEFIKKIR